MAGCINYTAGGNVAPSRFVMAQYPIDDYVIQSDGTQPILGIGQEGSRYYPGSAQNNTNSGLAAVSGDPIAVYSDQSFDEVLLQIGANVTGGQMLKADANGMGIPMSTTSTATQWVGAQALQTGVSGDLIKVRPRFFGGRIF